jgi:hypothetical protein
MRRLGWMVPILAAAVALVTAGSAAAATTYTDSISGHEYTATSTQGRFAGTASGNLPGYWNATVDHTPLSTSATITGGDLYLATYLNGAPATVTGDFTGGTVNQTSGYSGCVNQQYAVIGYLGSVGFGSTGTGTGTFTGTLTHYRTKIFGYCTTYSASITGSLTVAPS